MSHISINRKTYRLINLLLAAVLLVGAVTAYWYTNSPMRYEAMTARHHANDSTGFYTKLVVNDIDLGDALIDTGAADTSISIQKAVKAHIPWRKGKITEYSLADNSTNVCRVLDASVKVGEVVRTAPLSVCEKGDNLLGMSFMSQTVMHIEKNALTIK